MQKKGGRIFFASLQCELHHCCCCWTPKKTRIFWFGEKLGFSFGNLVADLASLLCQSSAILSTHTHKQIERKVFRFLTSNQDVVTLNLDSETESRIAQFAPTNTKIQS